MHTQGIVWSSLAHSACSSCSSRSGSRRGSSSSAQPAPAVEEAALALALEDAAQMFTLCRQLQLLVRLAPAHRRRVMKGSWFSSKLDANLLMICTRTSLCCSPIFESRLVSIAFCSSVSLSSLITCSTSHSLPRARAALSARKQSAFHVHARKLECKSIELQINYEVPTHTALTECLIC